MISMLWGNTAYCVKLWWISVALFE